MVKINEEASKQIYKNGLLLGVTVHEFMLISICQCLCHIMIVSWSHDFIGYAMSYNDSIIGFVVSMVS